MTILYNEIISEPSYLASFILISTALGLACMYGHIIGSSDEPGTTAGSALPIMIIAAVVAFFGCVSSTFTPFTSKNAYYATIDDASLSEVLEEYNIIEQKGSLFILEEKVNE